MLRTLVCAQQTKPKFGITRGDGTISNQSSKKNNEPRVNRKIRAREVRVIHGNGDQLGVLLTEKALQLAEEEGLDLVEVADKAKPPVCKLMDYGKYKYQQKQKAKEAKANATRITVKEVKLRPKTDDHDIDVKIRHIQRFIAAGDKAKVTVQFRGREITHKERGSMLLERILEELGDEVNVESRPKMEGRSMIMLLGPKSKK